MIDGNSYDVQIRELAESVFIKFPESAKSHHYNVFVSLFDKKVLSQLRAARASNETVRAVTLRSRHIFNEVRASYLRKQQPYPQIRSSFAPVKTIKDDKAIARRFVTKRTTLCPA